MSEAIISKLTVIAPVLGVAGLAFAVWCYFWVMRQPEGDEKMRTYAQAIHDGAMTFLKREYTAIGVFVLVLLVVLTIAFYKTAALIGVAYLFGAACSLSAGYLGMKASTKSGVRTMEAARSMGIGQALQVAFTGGAVMGMAVAAIGVLGLGVMFALTRSLTSPEIIQYVTGFSMGASSVALFARVGGGIFTKAADVGADLVGKIEAGIPEDDPRNPATLADNVGDNVGDTAGMGADLFESYVGSVVATMVIGATLGATFMESLAWMTLPLALICVGVVASAIGIASISIFKRLDPQSALNYATALSCLLLVGASIPLILFWVQDLRPFVALMAGLVAGVLIGGVSQYFTSGPPVQRLAGSCEFGSAPNIISGIALGFGSAVPCLLILSGAIWISFTAMGLYGIAFAGVGMLSIIGIIMATDSYGPIADNAGGIAEVAGVGEGVRRITDRLDSIGNTTAAIGKGFAIGSAALTALALFAAYKTTTGLTEINLAKHTTFIGLFLGAMMPCLFAALTLKSVGRAADKMVAEVRRQFRELGILEGRGDPDYGSCVDIVTRSALREMILPGVVAVIAPIAVGFLIGVEALGGFLAGAVVMGVVIGLVMANSGGAWDNAKKWIEDGNLGGKGSDAHKAAVVGDTVGDPFKDTTGPAMNILIKLMTIVSVVFAPLF